MKNTPAPQKFAALFGDIFGSDVGCDTPVLNMHDRMCEKFSRHSAAQKVSKQMRCNTAADVDKFMIKSFLKKNGTAFWFGEDIQ